MASLADQLTDKARWKTIWEGQCAYRTTTPNTKSLRCKHFYTNTAQCHLVGCPIVQSNYVALQRERGYDVIYMVKKNPDAESLNDMWSDEELPEDHDEALKVVTEAVQSLNPVLQEAVLAKFEHLYNISETIRESMAEEGEAGEDLDMTEDELLEGTDAEED